MEKLLLEMSGIDKTFPGVKALDNAQLQLKVGEVHALLGENGAGKSTLIKVLGGIYAAERGEVKISGKVVHIQNVHHAQLQGVSIIHQELMVVPEMSIAENLFMGREKVGRFFLDSKTMLKEAQQLLDSAGLLLSASTKLKELSIANQQMIEILRAISFGAKIIVMDEPTSSLSEKEVLVLFAAIRRLKKLGIGIIYISHKMSELYEISDRITVLRDGKYIGTVITKETNQTELISMMVGRELKNFYIKESSATDEIVLEVENLSDGNMVKDVSFSLHKGEILGFSGLIGAGRSEAMQCLFGLSKKVKGVVKLNGEKIEITNPKDAIKKGFGLVPESRKDQGIFPLRNIRFNASIEILDKFIHGIFVDSKLERELTELYCEKMDVRTPSMDQLISKLSGGNQQKVIIARWLATNASILILDEPTRGVDVNAKAEIYKIINTLVKEEGISILLVSSDLPEIINMSDRIAVMNQGYITGILNSDFTQEKIMHLATIDISKEDSYGRIE